MENKGKHSLYIASDLVAWIALILALIALFLAYRAFNRSGANLNRVMSQKTQEYQNCAEKVAVETQVRTELMILRGKIEGAQAGEDIGNQVQNTRKNIQDIYNNANASLGLKNEGQNIDQDLSVIGQDVRTNTSQGLEKLKSLIDRIGKK